MASSRIVYLTGNPYGSLLAAAVANLIAARQSLDRLAQCMNSMVGSPADYTQLEQAGTFGAPAGSGQALYNLVVGLQADLDAQWPNMIDLDTGR